MGVIFLALWFLCSCVLVDCSGICVFGERVGTIGWILTTHRIAISGGNVDR